MIDPRFVERAEPEEVFAALSEEIRIAILRALWTTDGPATFSALREAVGSPDSGRFNYHLDVLLDQFVTKTDDGYELTQAGKRINGAIEAGSYTTGVQLEPVRLEHPCRTCGGELSLSYEDETVTVGCGDCPTTAQFAVPPSAFSNCTREAIPRVASRYLQATFHRIDAGFCPYCDGSLQSTVETVADSKEAAAEAVPEEIADVRDLPLARYDCRRCGATYTAGLGIAFHQHPTVIGFYRDRGEDVRKRLVWTLPSLDPDRERVRSTDPFRASVTFDCGDDRLTLTVDADLDVVDVDSS